MVFGLLALVGIVLAAYAVSGRSTAVIAGTQPDLDVPQLRHAPPPTRAIAGVMFVGTVLMLGGALGLLVFALHTPHTPSALAHVSLAAVNHRSNARDGYMLAVDGLAVLCTVIAAAVSLRATRGLGRVRRGWTVLTAVRVLGPAASAKCAVGALAYVAIIWEIAHHFGA